VPESPQTISTEAFLALRHPLQRKRFALALFFALILFPLIGAALVAGTVVLVVPLFALLLWMADRTWFARFMGNSILVSELNYPRIHLIGEDLKTVIRYNKPVNIFVYEQGSFNAFLIKFFFYRRAVFLNSELLEAGVTDDELRWLIGRFIGYLRARREAGFWGWTIRAAQQLLVFNLFLMPYERALVYSGDRIALAVINGDISTGVSAMQKLLVGRQLGYSVNPSGIVDQHRQVKGSFFALLARLGMPFPHMTARYVDLISFAKVRYPEQFARFEGENPGLPADLEQLAALPNAPAVSSGGDPIWVSLAAAVVVLALLTLLTVKVIVPRLRHADDTSTTYTPPVDDSALQPSTQASTPATTAASATQPDTTAAAQPQPYTSADGHFSVNFPASPTLGSQQVALPGNDSMTLYQFQFEGGGVSYVVMYNDYPAKYAGAEPQSILANVRDGSLESTKATLVSDEVVDMNGVPGRKFQFTDKDGSTYFARDFLDGSRLYQVIVTVTAASSATSAGDFLDSFHIL
jgi:hypothetical protein